MAERRVEFTVVVDLTRYSKNADYRSMDKIAASLGDYAVQMMEDRGYGVRRSYVDTLLHYLRHDRRVHIRKPKVRKKKLLVAS